MARVTSSVSFVAFLTWISLFLRCVAWAGDKDASPKPAEKPKNKMELILPNELTLGHFACQTKIPFSDMEPNIPKHSCVEVDGQYYNSVRRPSTGDVVAYYHPVHKTIVHFARIVAVGGQILEIDGTEIKVGHKKILRQPISDSKCSEYNTAIQTRMRDPDSSSDSINIGSRKCFLERLTPSVEYVVVDEDVQPTGAATRIFVPKNQLFVLGDNRYSTDVNVSKNLNLISLSSVIGKFIGRCSE